MAYPSNPCARGRFAPSPSGPLHLGNLRTALLAWLFARRFGGSFVLRVEDLDQSRARPGAVDEMILDLRWLGLDWDEGPDLGGPYAPYIQSGRGSIYQEQIDLLASKGLVYPCYCTRSDILAAVAAPNAPITGSAPYSGACRDPERRERLRRLHPARRPAYRFRVHSCNQTFSDSVLGPCTFSLSAGAHDFVVQRSDGVPAYQLAVVVDDAAMGIGQVVRGDDLLDSTPRQMLLYDALGLRSPIWAHVPVLRDETGMRLAKRVHSAGVTAARLAGARPEPLIGRLAAGCGLIPAGIACTARELCQVFDSRKPAPQPDL
jgi:glutamyl-tRNA synthetase